MKKQDNSREKAQAMTKIVATIGPASADEKTLGELVNAGMSVARLNFSHGCHEDHRQVIEKLRKISKIEGKPLAILQDLSGPKIRLGEMDAPVSVFVGQTVTLGSAETGADLRTDLADFSDYVNPGDTILIDDGYMELEVKNISEKKVYCEARTEGEIRSRKGINLPNLSTSIPVFTEKDKRDLQFGIEHNVDIVAMSFVDSAKNVKPMRAMLTRAGVNPVLVAKIERPAALKNIAEIIEAFDGIMIARGDLGVEVPPEKVPLIQKKLIELANNRNKLVITATQMLESMITNPRPTRAEASDVSNAILDGSDAIMLSGETAVGSFPVKAVEMMKRIALHTEGSELYRRQRHDIRFSAEINDTEAIVNSAAAISAGLDARFILVFSYSGSTACVLSKKRPGCPIVAFTPRTEVVRKLAAFWGIYPLQIEFTPHTDEMIMRGEELLRIRGLAVSGDKVITVAGVTPMKGATNMLRIGELS